MAHSSTTPNANLPQFADDDKPSWTGDFNEAMTKIDAKYAELIGRINDLQTQVNNKVDKA